MLDPIYYLYPSLPALVRTAPPPLGFDEFLRQVRQFLPSKAVQILQDATLFQDQPRPARLTVLNRWYAREHAVRNELAVLRARHKGIDPRRYLRSVAKDHEAVAIAREAFEIESPIKAADYLDQRRWDFLDGLEVGQDFNLERLAIYLLRLRLLQRRGPHDPVEGEQWLGNCLKRTEELTRSAIHEYGEIIDNNQS